MASQESGAQALWNIDDLSPLIEITPQQPLALDVIVYMALNRYKGLAKSITSPETVAKTLTSLVFAFRDTSEPQTLFESLTKIFTSLPYEVPFLMAFFLALIVPLLSIRSHFHHQTPGSNRS